MEAFKTSDVIIFYVKINVIVKKKIKKCNLYWKDKLHFITILFFLHLGHSLMKKHVRNLQKTSPSIYMNNINTKVGFLGYLWLINKGYNWCPTLTCR